MNRKVRDIEKQQRIADRMLQTSRNDARWAEGLKEKVNDIVDRMQRLNQENSFAVRVELAYRGVR